MNATLQQLILRAYGIADRVLPLRREPIATIYSQAYFAYKRFAEDALARLLRARAELVRGGNVIDAGANIGYTARLFAGAIDAGFVVHAFEPEPSNAAMLRRNVRRAANVVVHQCALGAAAGHARLRLNRDNPSDHRIVNDAGASTIDVDIVRGDDVVPSPVAFVKIDVQGYELEVSRGIESIVQSNPRIAVVFEYMRQDEELLDFYRSRGFTLTPLGSGEYYDILAERHSA
jgi:FkbM family methyltransferase